MILYNDIHKHFICCPSDMKVPLDFLTTRINTFSQQAVVAYYLRHFV